MPGRKVTNDSGLLGRVVILGIIWWRGHHPKRNPFRGFKAVHRSWQDLDHTRAPQETYSIRQVKNCCSPVDDVGFMGTFVKVWPDVRTWSNLDVRHTGFPRTFPLPDANTIFLSSWRPVSYHPLTPFRATEALLLYHTRDNTREVSYTTTDFSSIRKEGR
jgi:hypothetical protein